MLFRQLNEILKQISLLKHQLDKSGNYSSEDRNKVPITKDEASKFAAKLPEDEPSEDVDAWLDEIEELKKHLLKCTNILTTSLN